MDDLLRRILGHAGTNHGVIHRREAIALGVQPHDWQHLFDRGVLQPIDLQVGRASGHPTSWRQQIHAATLASGGVASRRSAARLHGLYRTAALDVLVPQNRRYRDGIACAHRSLDLIQADLTTVDGTPCTTTVRTLLDLGAVVGEPSLDVVVRRALHHRQVDLDALVTRFLQVARRGRRGVGRLRKVLDGIDPAMGATQSALETLALRAIRANGLPEPAVQHEVHVDGRRFVLDIAWPFAMVFLEIDGPHHAERHHFERDRIRQNLLVRAGWTPLRFTGAFVRRYPAEMAATTHRTLVARARPAA